MDLNAIGDKLKQFGSDVANGTRDAFDQATSAVKNVFQITPPPGANNQSTHNTAHLNSTPLVGSNPTIPALQNNPQPVVANPTTQNALLKSYSGPVPVTTPKNLTQLQKANQGGLPGSDISGSAKQFGKDTLNMLGGPLIANTIKGEIIDPLKNARQETQALLHGKGDTNAQLANQFSKESSESMGGFGGAASIPAYAIASRFGGKSKNADLSAINVNPKSGVGGQLLTVGQQSLNSSVPLGLSDLPSIMNAIKDGAAPDAATLLTSRPPEPTTATPVPPDKAPALTEAQEPIADPDNPLRPPRTGRFMDAEQAAIDEVQHSGSFDQAVLRYAQTAGVDEMTAMNAVIPALREAGLMPVGDSADSGADLKPINIPEGTPPKTAQAAQDLTDSYLSKQSSSKTAEELVGKSEGKTAEFSRRGDNLQRAMEQELTPVERQAVRDNLEGATKPGEVTPKVEAVTQVMRQLNEMGYNVLDHTQKTGMARVRAYATRLSNFGGKAGEGKGVVSKLKDLFDVSSRFSKHRQIGKFVSDDGEVRYGTQGDAKLSRDKNGELTGNGKIFHPKAVSTRELSDNGYNYETNYGEIANVYHSSVGKAKARYDALQELLSNPEKFGIHETDTAQPGEIPITKVPELDGMYAKPSIVKRLTEALSGPEQRSIIERIWQGMVHSVVQPIIMNPWFHGRNLNQLAGMAAGKFKGATGALQLKAAYADLARMGRTDREALATRLFRAGGGLEEYGARDGSAISNALDAVHLPHINKANAVAMAKIDETIRLSLFHLATRDGGVSDEEAAQTIDQFMGDRKAGGQISQDVGLFWNYFRTRARVAGSLITHPKEYGGASIVFAEQAAVLYGVTKAFQAWTGNKHASLGHPGLFGLVNEADNLIHGRFGSVTSSELNPIITTGINQVTGTDMYSGQHITNRKDNAISTLVAPTQYTSKISSGKASPGQEAMQFLTGASLPHVKGTPAAPNFKSGALNLLNTSGAKPAPNEGNIKDKTGIDQANSYYNAKAKGLATLGPNDQNSTATYNKWLSRNHDPATGNTIQLSPSQSKASWNDLAADPKALNAAQTMEKNQPDHDPIWDLSPQQLKVYATYESIADGDPNRTVLEQKNPWLNGAFAQEQQWANKQIFSGQAEKPPGYVAYPTITSQQNNLMTQVTQLSGIQNRTPAQESQLTSLEDNPALQKAFGLLDSYTNDRRKSEGLSPIPYPAQNLTTAQEGLLTQEAALPSGTGAKTAFIKANQGQWNQIQNILAKNTMYDVEKQGAIVNQGGTSTSLLKDVYNAGKYDIAAPSSPGGSYTLNPEAAFAQGQSSSSSSSFPLIALPKRPKVKRGRAGGKPRMMKYHKAKLPKSAPRVQSKGVLQRATVARPTAVLH